jgi:YfiH family protein
VTVLPPDAESSTGIIVLPADLGPGVRGGFTTRTGGVSTGTWEGLDLALHVGDDPDAVWKNRERLAAWAGAPVRFGCQVHGTVVRVLVGADESSLKADAFEADALVTAERGLPIGVLVADCVPVLLADPQARVVAAVHAGRRGLLAGVVPRALDVMISVGAAPGRVRAVVGPAAGPCCYEVPAELADEAAARRPELRGTTTWGSPSLDLRSGAAAELRRGGVADVAFVGGCTIEDRNLYSYRRGQVTGRFAGIVTVLS